MHTDQEPTTCAIIVTWNPDPARLLSLLAGIGEQSDFLVLDNASSNATAFIDAVSATPRCCGVVQLDSNIGLASALNQGLRRLQAGPHRYAVLFDQDSQVPAGFFAALVSAHREAQRQCGDRVAAVGPRITHPATGRRMPFKLFDRICGRSDRPIQGSADIFESDFLITSGCLLDLHHLNGIGLMKDSYFIDNVDLEWSFRAIHRGYLLVGTDRTHLLHSIGEDDTSPLVRAGLMHSHGPSRTYYSTRNRFDLYRQSYAPIGWKLRDLPRFLLKSAWLLLFSSQRGDYWRSIRKGIADAGSLS